MTLLDFIMWLEIDLHEIGHFWNPASLNEMNVIGMSIIDLVILQGCKLHGQTKIINILFIDLTKTFEVLYYRNISEFPG